MNVTYDSRNRVVRRTSPNGTMNLTYSGWNLIEERNGGGELEQTYVHGAGVDELLVKVSSSGPAYYHHDGLVSTVALTGENGELLESYRYDAFGAATILSPSTLDPRLSTAFGNRFLFTGREWLGQAGIYDYRNRVYSAQIGRFLQTDPIRFSAGDVNLYRFVGNGPVNGRDPMGLLADAYFNIAQGLLTVIDRDTGATVTVYAHAGSGPFIGDPNSTGVREHRDANGDLVGGPTPVGSYDILNDRENRGWYELDMQDGRPGNDRNDSGPIRGALRLHPGDLSTGCVTVPNQRDYQRVNNIIGNTRATPFRDANGATRTRFGTVHVFTSNSPRGVLP